MTKETGKTFRIIWKEQPSIKELTPLRSLNKGPLPLSRTGFRGRDRHYETQTRVGRRLPSPAGGHLLWACCGTDKLGPHRTSSAPRSQRTAPAPTQSPQPEPGRQPCRLLALHTWSGIESCQFHVLHMSLHPHCQPCPQPRPQPTALTARAPAASLISPCLLALEMAPALTPPPCSAETT